MDEKKIIEIITKKLEKQLGIDELQTEILNYNTLLSIKNSDISNGRIEMQTLDNDIETKEKELDNKIKKMEDDALATYKKYKGAFESKINSLKQELEKTKSNFKSFIKINSEDELIEGIEYNHKLEELDNELEKCINNMVILENKLFVNNKQIMDARNKQEKIELERANIQKAHEDKVSNLKNDYDKYFNKYNNRILKFMASIDEKTKKSQSVDDTYNAEKEKVNKITSEEELELYICYNMNLVKEVLISKAELDFMKNRRNEILSNIAKTDEEIIDINNKIVELEQEMATKKEKVAIGVQNAIATATKVGSQTKEKATNIYNKASSLAGNIYKSIITKQEPKEDLESKSFEETLNEFFNTEGKNINDIINEFLGDDTEEKKSTDTITELIKKFGKRK